jgi:hypothetical protein
MIHSIRLRNNVLQYILWDILNLIVIKLKFQHPIYTIIKNKDLNLNLIGLFFFNKELKIILR